MKTNTEYKSEALAALKGNWPQAVLATFIVGAVCILVWTPYYWQYAKLLENATDIEATLLIASSLNKFVFASPSGAHPSVFTLTFSILSLIFFCWK